MAKWVLPPSARCSQEIKNKNLKNNLMILLTAIIQRRVKRYYCSYFCLSIVARVPEYEASKMQSKQHVGKIITPVNFSSMIASNID